MSLELFLRDLTDEAQERYLSESGATIEEVEYTPIIILEFEHNCIYGDEVTEEYVVTVKDELTGISADISVSSDCKYSAKEEACADYISTYGGYIVNLVVTNIE
jgi:hypothetical protein